MQESWALESLCETRRWVVVNATYRRCVADLHT